MLDICDFICRHVHKIFFKFEKQCITHLYFYLTSKYISCISSLFRFFAYIYARLEPWLLARGDLGPQGIYNTGHRLKRLSLSPWRMLGGRASKSHNTRRTTSAPAASNPFLTQIVNCAEAEKVWLGRGSPKNKHQIANSFLTYVCYVIYYNVLLFWKLWWFEIEWSPSTHIV